MSKCQLKGAHFLHLACQGAARPLPPVSYATVCACLLVVEFCFGALLQIF